ncbi:MAG: MarR family winged helix-turn-helix transcriptional regulator [Gammaproteobacteria bacterium]
MARPKFELPTDESVGYLVRSLHRSFNRVLAQRIAHANLTNAQWFFLRALWENNFISQRELSNSIGLTEPTTVSALKIMEKNGLIQRKRDTKDARRVIVRLTRKGQRLKDRLLPCAYEINQVALKGISAGEIRQLKQLLLRMRKRLEEEATKSKL